MMPELTVVADDLVDDATREAFKRRRAMLRCLCDDLAQYIDEVPCGDDEGDQPADDDRCRARAMLVRADVRDELADESKTWRIVEAIGYF